jgi:hypothetical protein
MIFLLFVFVIATPVLAQGSDPATQPCEYFCSSQQTDQINYVIQELRCLLMRMNSRPAVIPRIIELGNQYAAVQDPEVISIVAEAVAFRSRHHLFSY